MALAQLVEAAAELGGELGGAEQTRVHTEPKHPRDEAARIGVAREEQAVALLEGGPGVELLVLAERLGGVDDPAVAPEVAFDLPGDALGDEHPRDALLVAELPVRAVGVGARIEVLRTVEVVLGLGRVRDLASHPGEAEDADRLALVRETEEVELAALEEQVVGIDLAGGDLVAAHRVVVEDDRLVAEDRGLHLREPGGELVAARRGGDPQRDRALLGCAQRARPAPGDLLQRETQRLGVGEFTVEQGQRGL